MVNEANAEGAIPMAPLSCAKSAFDAIGLIFPLLFLFFFFLCSPVGSSFLVFSFCSCSCDDNFHGRSDRLLV